MRSVLSKILKENKFVCLVLLSISIIIGIMMPVTVQYEKNIIDIITEKFGMNDFWLNLLVPILVLVVANICIYLLPTISDLIYEKLRMKMDLNLHRQLINKVETIDYKYLEDKKVVDLYSRITKNLDTKSRDLIKNICELITAFIGIIGFFAIIYSVSWISALVFLGLFLLLLFFADLSAKNFHKLNQHFSETERRVVYLDSIENTRSFSHEKKLFRFTNYINDKRSDFLLGQRKGMKKYDYKYGLTFSMIDTAGYICTVIMMIVMLPFIGSGRISMGLFISASHAAVNLNLATQNKIRTIFNSLMEHRRFWKEYVDFLELPDQDKQKNLNSIKETNFTSIEFCNVSFGYENGAKVLNNVSFKLEKDKHYALVGENGSGKSTIIKLLLRLYNVDEGTILLNNKNIKEFSQSELCDIYATVFQDFSKYYISIRDNITFGNNDDEAALRKVVEETTLKNCIDKFQAGSDTLLGEIYEEGVNISGGEWQRIGFARALYHNNPVLLLDEPTSALDPIAENDIYMQFRKISAEKTTLFITHRLASTKMADSILVLHKGEIAESGTHDELISKNGLYNMMYTSQRKWYKESGTDE